MQIKGILNELAPPLLLNVLKRARRRYSYDTHSNIVYWLGNYTSWKEACRYVSGYEDKNILEKVKTSILSVKNGEAAYERDSVIFDQIQYSWPLLTALFKHAIENQGHLNVLDFGDSLGSSYFQNRDYIKSLNSVKWNIVEQEHFVECGKSFIEDGHLKFYFTIEDCLQDRNPDFLLLSGVIQCLENPYDWMRTFSSHGFKYIVIDRTAFIDDRNDRLTIEHVPVSIYKASYPSWFFNHTAFVKGVNHTLRLQIDGRVSGNDDALTCRN